MFDQLQSGIGDSWLMFTDPMGYYNKMQQRSQATASRVTEGGTTRSIDITKTDLFTSTPGELNPEKEPLVGSIEIENQGEFNANRIRLDMQATWEAPTSASTTNSVEPLTVGTLSKFNCSSATSNSLGTCEWNQATYPGEIKQVNFVFDKNSWSSGSTNLAECSPEDCKDANATFVHGGQMIDIKTNITYNYNVNVSIPVEVMDQARYRDLLQKKEITLEELTSQYTGGPVKATLWSQRQPIRSDETSLFVASLYNDGERRP